jgi:hypothetical protein
VLHSFACPTLRENAKKALVIINIAFTGLEVALQKLKYLYENVNPEWGRDHLVCPNCYDLLMDKSHEHFDLDLAIVNIPSLPAQFPNRDFGHIVSVRSLVRATL